jgi:hypothetical protein
VPDNATWLCRSGSVEQKTATTATKDRIDGTHNDQPKVELCIRRSLFAKAQAAAKIHRMIVGMILSPHPEGINLNTMGMITNGENNAQKWKLFFIMVVLAPSWKRMW